METTVLLELVIVMECSALLPTFTVPKLTDVGLTEICVDAAAVSVAEIKRDSWITANKSAR